MKGRVAIVTGATSGIGAATAKALALEGARVLVVGRRAERGAEVVAHIKAEGGEAAYFRADMTVDAEIAGMVDTAVERWGRLDIAFNNAGMFGPEQQHHEYEDAVWDQWLSLNLTGVYRCMKYEIRAMLASIEKTGKSGAIVNNASIMGHRGSPYAGPAYAATKHGVIGLTRQAAIDYVAQGIRVNAVSPGPTLTEITAGTAALPPDAFQKIVDDLLPIGRMGRAEEVAAAVVFLCSDAAAMVTGHDIPVDGGQLARL